jgi:hypothetical protein
MDIRRNELAIYAKAISVIQSSGTGKSRIRSVSFDEVAF